MWLGALKAMGTDMASATEEQFGDYLARSSGKKARFALEATMKKKLDYASGTASSLRSEFSEKMKEPSAFEQLLGVSGGVLWRAAAAFTGPGADDASVEQNSGWSTKLTCFRTQP